jgi:hypothetical protein
LAGEADGTQQDNTADEIELSDGQGHTEASPYEDGETEA